MNLDFFSIGGLIGIKSRHKNASNINEFDPIAKVSTAFFFICEISALSISVLDTKTSFSQLVNNTPG